MVFGPKYFTPEALDNLKYYKYAAEDRSILVWLFFKRFWDLIVTFVPVWVAPNLITATGFSLILLNFLTLCYYDWELNNADVPSWVFLSWAIGIFTYQVLDNIDGKQARKTGSSSPLGEIFDHGCDSLFATLSIITLNCSLSMVGWEAWFFNLSVMITFCFSHWEEWHTGKLILTEYGNPTEAQLFMVLGHSITYVSGKEWWFQDICVFMNNWCPIMDWGWMPMAMRIRVSTWSAGCLWVLAAVAITDNTRVVLKNVRETNKNLGESLMIVAPLVSHIVFTGLWYAISPADIVHNYPIPAICITGLMCSYTLDFMLMNRITMSKFELTKPIFVLPIVGFLIALITRDATCDFYGLVLVSTLLVLAYAHMVVGVIQELCDHLNIYCFKIPYPKEN